MSSRSASKPPLITPSASPPTSKKIHSHHLRGRSASAAPTKRPRPSSRAPSVAANSTHNPEDNTNHVVDMAHERGQSVMRLMNAWAQLEERYSRPIEEDDIVDLVTGNVVKDRGVLRGMTAREFGKSADDDMPDRSRSMSRMGSSSTQDSSIGNSEEDEESDDELDSFAHLNRPTKSLTKDSDDIDNEGGGSETGEDDADEAQEKDIAAIIKTRVHALDQDDVEDAADLKEFLEAEKRRRELYGIEDEDDDHEQPSHREGSDRLDQGSKDDNPGESDKDNDHDAKNAVPPSDSEDELAVWNANLDSSSPTRPSASSSTDASQPEAGPSRLPATSQSITVTPKPKRTARGSPKTIKSKKHPERTQLQTPPLSHSSGPSPFSHISSDNEAYYDYTVPIPHSSPPSPDNSLPIASSPLPPSSPPPSSPLPPSSPPSDYLLSTQSPSTSRQIHDREDSSSPPPSSPSKPERASTRGQKFSTSKPASARLSSTRVPPAPFVLVPPKKPSSSTVKPVTEDDNDDWNLPSSSIIPRVDLSKAASKNKMIKKKAESAKGKEKETTSGLPRQERRASSPGHEGAEGIARRTRSQSQSRWQRSPPSTATRSIDKKPQPSQAFFGWKGKEKEVVVDDQEDGGHTSDRLKKRKRGRSSSVSEPERNVARSLSPDSPGSSKLHPPKQRPKLSHRDSDTEEIEKGRKPKQYRRHSHKYESMSDSPQKQKRAQSYMDPHYPPPYVPADVPQLNPLYDPRAQSILSNAFHQLSALFGRGWAPPSMYDDEHRSQPPYIRAQSHHSPHPYPPLTAASQYNYPMPPQTPRHHRDRPRVHSISASGSSPKSTRFTTPTHRPHPHDPNWSQGILPPESSSPEPEESDEDVDVGESVSSHPSTSISRSGVVQREEELHPVKRASSLVRRSRSRGRRVSWGSVEHIDVRVFEEERREAEEIQTQTRSRSSATSSRQATPGTPRRQKRSEEESSVKKEKGTQPEIIELTDSDSEAEAPRERRGQTPAPEAPKGRGRKH
ncbi:hypothetical protein WG66_008154 [Moniliophthora roreri]|uniref:Uncharacterized protein n=1 Tax=Moniliophthora roreri TaxID=221103 RepID=A0A0W0FKG2_MONRR|nr:hypothetical protein WG66_008154 [Moniliophthora roreri]